MPGRSETESNRDAIRRLAGRVDELERVLRHIVRDATDEPGGIVVPDVTMEEAVAVLREDSP